MPIDPAEYERLKAQERARLEAERDLKAEERGRRRSRTVNGATG